jgi:putative methyltransferase (TIGR04325 family)
VCDLPRIIEGAREQAARNAAHQLSFTSAFEELAGFDVLLAAGSLQYVETDLADKLRALPRRPTHLILNKLPLLSNAVGYVTLQNTLHSYNPYAVRNRETFLRSLETLGYKLIDEWENYDVRCLIPFHPERSLDHYKGLYLRLEQPPGA